MKTANKRSGSLYLMCAFILAGTSVVSARFVSGRLGAFTITALSLLFALLILVPISGKRLFQTIKNITVPLSLALFMQAVCGIFLFRYFLLTGLKYTSATEAGILTGATPAITSLLAILVLKERITLNRAVGICFTVLGILAIQGMFEAGVPIGGLHLVGNILVLLAAVSESSFNILSRILANKTESYSIQIDPVVQTTIVSFFAMLLCLVPAYFEAPFKHITKIRLVEWSALIWYGIFVTALAFICWYSGIRRSGAFAAAAFSGMMPLTSMILSAVVLKEAVGMVQWAGGISVIMGMVLIGMDQK